VFAAPGGLGVGWIDHADPFHTSARVSVLLMFALSFPMAVHALAAEHETAAREFSFAPGTLGVAWMDHADPFHASARVRDAPDGMLDNPTAVHAFGAAQETPNRTPGWWPVGLGVGWMDQADPFQCSARVIWAPVRAMKSPTAVQDRVSGQEMPNR